MNPQYLVQLIDKKIQLSNRQIEALISNYEIKHYNDKKQPLVREETSIIRIDNREFEIKIRKTLETNYYTQPIEIGSFK